MESLDSSEPVKKMPVPRSFHLTGPVGFARSGQAVSEVSAGSQPPLGLRTRGSVSSLEDGHLLL